MQPAYIKTYNEGRFQEKISRLKEILLCCTLCPRNCRVNRTKGQKGFCGAGNNAVVSSAFPHFGEESCLVGRHGSGTIFFSHCNLKCLFCQNYEISHLAEGEDITPQDLAEAMLGLEKIGCHNVNLVTPTHFVPQIIEALEIAVKKGLSLPIVYNCGGYESQEIIEILEGIIDIYMPDVKFSSSGTAKDLCQAPDYFLNLKKILKIMHKQVGDLEIFEGIAQRGLLVRHLVMPHGLSGTAEIMEFIAQELSLNTYINIMAQYRPCAYAFKFPELNRAITSEEYAGAKETARGFGLHRFDQDEDNIF